MYCAEAAKTWIRGVAGAIRLSSPFQQAINLFPRYPYPNPTEARLPVHTGGGVPLLAECNRDEKLTSWAKVNLALSFSSGLALLSIPSSFINEQFTSFATYTVGVYVVFLLSMTVYCMPSRLYKYKTINVTILSISSAIISGAYALILKVVLYKGSTSPTHTLYASSPL